MIWAFFIFMTILINQLRGLVFFSSEILDVIADADKLLSKCQFQNKAI